MATTSIFRISALMLFIAAASASLVTAGEKKTTEAPKTGIYLDLTEEFYRALREDAGDTRRYTNRMSEDYLRQIAVSTRFMVETNLQILRQQEKMIQLLEALRDAGKAAGKK